MEMGTKGQSPTPCREVLNSQQVLTQHQQYRDLQQTYQADTASNTAVYSLKVFKSWLALFQESSLQNQGSSWYYSITPIQTSDRATWTEDQLIEESQTTFLLKKNMFKHPFAERD
jgi:hypothetical protein